MRVQIPAKGKNPRFTAFLDSNLHTRLAIITANELGLAFPPRNLPQKFRPDPSTFYLVIVVTDKQTDRQTYAGYSIIPRESFRGDNKLLSLGGDTICPRRWQFDSRRIYVRPRTGPQSAHLWWPASCRQPACLNPRLGQTDRQTDRRTDRGIA